MRLALRSRWLLAAEDPSDLFAQVHAAADRAIRPFARRTWLRRRIPSLDRGMPDLSRSLIRREAKAGASATRP